MKKIILIITCLIAFNGTKAFSGEKDMRNFRKELIYSFFINQASNIFIETYKEAYKRIAINNVDMGEKIIKNICNVGNLVKNKILSLKINNLNNKDIQIEYDEL